MASTIFATPANNVSTTVGVAGYAATSGVMVVSARTGSQFPSLSGGNFCRITVIQKAFAYTPNAPSSVYTIYKVTGVTGDTLTIDSAIEGTSDRDYISGDVVELRDTSGTFSDIYTAIDGLQNTPTFNTSVALADGVNVSVGTTTGSQIGTSSSQKLGFFSATPIARPSGDVVTALGNLGLISSPTVSAISTINLNPLCSGRLTLTTATPYSTSQTGTTLYFTPYCGNAITLYDGSALWNLLRFSETSIAVPGTTGLYDVFAYNNSGSLALEFSSAWTTTGNGTAAAGTRSQALTTQDGIYVKSGATTRRYLGTIYSVSGTASDTPALRGIWNYPNRLPHQLYIQNTGTNWSLASISTWSPTGGSSGINVKTVTGLMEASTTFIGGCTFQVTNAGAAGAVSIGFDSSSTNSGDNVGTLGNQTGYFTASSSMTIALPIGLHTTYLLNYCTDNVSYVSFFGSGNATYTNCVVSGVYWC